MDDSLGVALLTATAYQENKDSYLLIASNLYKAQKIYDFMAVLLPKEDVILFPGDELIRAESVSQGKELVSARLFGLYQILNKKKKVVIANLAAVARYLPSPELFHSLSLSFRIGEHYDLSEIKRKLVQLGYTQVSKVDQSLEFAYRGDILDIYSVNNDDPIRLEFFDDEIESIRYFDLSTQLSKKKVDSILILPANEFILTEDEKEGAKDKILDILEKDKSDLSYSDFENLYNLTYSDLEELSENHITPRVGKYFSLCQNKHFSLLDYCEDSIKVLVDEEALKTADEMMLSESMNYLRECFEDGRLISHLSITQDVMGLLANHRKATIHTSTLKENEKDIEFSLKPVPFTAGKSSDAISIIRSYLNENVSLSICLDNKEYLNTVIDILDKEQIPFKEMKPLELPPVGHIGLTLLNLPHGFILEKEKVVYLTGKELFNERVRVTRFDSRFKSATILKSYEDLTPGDYVVHEYQGIGQFIGLKTIETDGEVKDFLAISYHGDEILYVPLNQFQLVRKFVGKEGNVPRLSRLHTKDWENTKKKIKERINELAERLFNLYVERSKIKGFAFQKDDELQEEFELACPFILTPDQQRSVEEIKRDMESEKPMNRLLCGDVGFGKTEVAFRAIFKAISSGKQVALLCPTTLLAKQHYQRAVERFSPFGIKIAVFSRLVPEKEQDTYIRGLADGSIHLAIGTHRLLSKDIVYQDLGLLIIDEEQRFGVEQKEKLKELKSNIDVLTLSATPIPRTLQISLLGVRQLSQINTAPLERMPIQTYVLPYKKDVVKELIEKELGREGQVFYLHNRVETLYECASRLQKMLPGVTIGVAHGQMNREDIEEVMTMFYQGQISVLVCTSIIENGIDIPNANMIIVEDSESYGLSQLYQIKGRVGRSNRIAYAYLMYNGNKVLKEETQKRLKALQEFSELGSGYKIAQRDLMIRGAGDILGPDQAGFIDSIGLDMYIKLLNEAVQEKIGNEPASEEDDFSSYLHLDAYIPKEYLSDSDKIGLYQEILSASSTDSLLAVKAKTRDVYGKLPRQVELLFTKRNIDLLLKAADIREVKDNKNNVELTLKDNFVNIKGIGNILFEALIPFLSLAKISYVNHTFRIVMVKNNYWLDNLEKLLHTLVEIAQNNKVEVL